MNDVLIADNAPMTLPECATPYVKMGIYRPGAQGSGPSQVSFANLTLTPLE
jgi:hypothetical protein